VIAIGTALGEFRHTVTTGVISGLGRGIQAGSQLGGSIEQLDNVIQTDAAINPGNSGGPLLNSVGQVIGINTAVAAQGQNIGFAIPINVVKDSLDNFEKTGKFDRAFLGVSYQIIPKETAILNNVPVGAYLRTVVEGSPAAQAGLVQGDIITKIDGQTLDDKNPLSTIISKKKSGDTVSVEYWREGQTKTIQVKLSTNNQ
jgi:S1-C subfamily serine protease